MILGVFTLRQFMKIVLDLMLDFGPILVFVFVFEYSQSIFTATSIMMVSTIIAVITSYLRDKRLPLFAIFTSALVLFFGFLTIYFKEPFFIQVKDTIQDVIIATSFLISYLLGYPLLKKMFGHVLPISTHTYNVMTINWIIHFYVLAILNEIARGFDPVEYWVYYKAISASITIIHGVIMIIVYKPEIIEGYRLRQKLEQ